MNFISCAKWVKQGVAKHIPDTVNLDEDELKEIVEPANNDDDDAGEPSNSAPTEDEYDFENYDNDDEVRVSLKGIATFDTVNKGKKKKKKKKYRDDSDDSEREDELIKEDDNLLVVGHVDEDLNTLDVYVYNENDDDMYLHHDLILKTPPLCIDWLNMPSLSESSNVCVIGSMSPVIDIWDLDMINSVAPVFRLGRHKKKAPEKNFGHTDAVLGVSWNSELQHILCSGSVDNTALLWDLDSGKVATEITVFNDKVQNLSWNPFNPYFLLTGCADGIVRNFDCRLYDEFQKLDLDSAVESMYWDVTNEYCCFIGTEDGSIYHIDWRMENEVLHQFQAHSKEVTGLCIDRTHPNALVSISTDECIKFWDTSEEFKMITSRDLKLESLHCIDLNPDYPYLACVGGSSEKHGKTIMNVINLNEISTPQQPVEKPNVIVAPIVSSIPILETTQSEVKPEPRVRIHKKKLRKKMQAELAKRKEKQNVKREKFRKIMTKGAKRM